MRNVQNVETRRDRKALARDAGLGRVSAASVLAGALCALATFELLAAIAGGIWVAINGGTNFGGTGIGQFKTVLGIILAADLFFSFLFGGYVSGRMSRRGGATNGLLAGIVGAIIAALATVAVVTSGTDNGVARVAEHIQIASTWHQWRFYGLAAIVVAAAAIVIGSLVGGIKGERWHGVLLARAVDPGYGPEAANRAAARKRMRDAEVARLSAANRAGNVSSVGRREERVEETRDEPAAAADDAPTRTRVTKKVRPVTETIPADAEPTAVADEPAQSGRR